MERRTDIEGSAWNAWALSRGVYSGDLDIGRTLGMGKRPKMDLETGLGARVAAFQLGAGGRGIGRGPEILRRVGPKARRGCPVIMVRI